MHAKMITGLAAAAAVLGLVPAAASADGRQVAEGDTGTHKAKVSIELDVPTPHPPVPVNFETEDGTATAGRDYVHRSGSVMFGALDTEKEITVTVLGDTLHEGDETFFVETDDTGLGDDDHHKKVTIIDDDPAPTVSVDDVTVGESAGLARFDVALSAASAVPATVAFATADGSAVGGSDYTARTGTLTFAPGETTKSVVVDVLGDAVHEDAESFVLGLSAPVEATLGTAQGRATVLDDDAPAPQPQPTLATTALGAPATAQPPVAQPAVLHTAFARLTRSHALLLRLTCSAGSTGCSGHLDVTRGASVVGSARYSLAAGTSSELGVKLSRSTRRLLARRGRLSLTAAPSSGAAIRFVAASAH